MKKNWREIIFDYELRSKNLVWIGLYEHTAWNEQKTFLVFYHMRARWMRKVVIFVQWIITWYYRLRIASLRLYFRKVFCSFQGECPQESFNVKSMEICSLIKKISRQKWLHYHRNSLQIPQFTLYFFQYLIEVQKYVFGEFI